MLLTAFLLLALTNFGPPLLQGCRVNRINWDVSAHRIAKSGDCQPNPGPVYKFPCGVCTKPCKSSQYAVACDTCDTWYHISCMNMPLSVYRGISPNVSWVCLKCGIPNFSTTLFDTPSSDSINTSIATDNTYSILSEDPVSPSHSSTDSFSSASSPGSPQHTSSPIRTLTRQHLASRQTFRILIVNFQSMRAKRSSFWMTVEESDPDIVIGCETWLYPDIFEKEVLPSGYHFVARKDRKQNRYGGVMIAAKDTICGLQLDIDTETEFVAASFQSPGGASLIIGSAYRPPSSDYSYMDDLCAKMRELHASHKNATIWIAGDLNLPDIDWKSNTVVGSNYPRNLSQKFLDTLYDISSEQTVDFPTRGANTLDLFITNRPTLVERTRALPGISDHDIVLVQARTTAMRNKPQSRKILLWDKAKPDDIRSAIQTFTERFSQYGTSTDIEVTWTAFVDGITKIVETMIPSKMSTTRHSQSWVTRRVKRLSRQKKRAYKKARKSGLTEDLLTYKRLQKEQHLECRKANHAYVRDMVTDNPKKLYSYVKGKKSDGSGISPLKADGVTHNEPSVKASILNKQFTGVFTKEDSSDIPTMGDSTYPDMPHFVAGVEGVKKLLSDLNPHKASGPDNVPTRLLKEYAEDLAPALTLVFNASLKQGKVPSDWKKANVSPIFKKGDRSDPANYRPISLTSVCCKVLEHIIHSQIMRHLDQQNILSDKQHGFRKRRSTESQLILTLQDLSSALDEGEQIDAVLLDFSKAFDKVPHQRLLTKVNFYGIRGTTLQWIESFLSNRCQRVIVEGQSSDSSPVTSGVPQGSVLGPLLFLLYINDLPQCVSSTSRLFADDSLVYRKIRTNADSQALQDDLDRLQEWEKKWMMSFNPSKCEVIRITRKRNPVKHTYRIHAQDLREVKGGKYLGVTITNNLSRGSHVETITKKASNSLAFLRRNLTACPRDVKAQAYQTLVRPILEYASTAWDPFTQTNVNQLESVQRRAARFVKGDYRQTSSTSQMVRELGWPTLQQCRSDAKLVMVYRITHDLIDISSAQYFHPLLRGGYGYGHRFQVPYCRTDVHKFSFFPSAIRLWNQLPEHLTTASSLEAFKRGLAGASK